MVAKKTGNGGTHVAKRPATPPLREPPARKIRTLVRAAEAYFGHARSLYWATRSTTLALPAEWHDDELYAERLAAIANATDKRALAHAWAMVVDDAWPEETHAALYAARQQRALYFSSRLPQRLEKAKTARTLRSVWAAVKVAGRAEELDAAFRASVQRLGLSESQAARIAA